MPVSAIVNYHVKRPERQAYHIDVGGVEGEILSPEHDPTEVYVRDVRANEAMVSFANDGVAFVERATRTSLTAPDATVANMAVAKAAWEDSYADELGELLTNQINAQEVIVFDHTVRIDDPKSGRKPARNVHSDYSPTGARQRLRDILGQKKANDWERGRFGFVNVWRPLKAPIERAPLGFVRPASVCPDDWVLLDLIYPDRVGQIMGLVANKSHEWVYLSRMTPDEVAIFSIYDSGGLPSVAHSALDLVHLFETSAPRMSVESRTLIRF